MTGVFSLFLFIVLHFIFATLILFGSKNLVQGVIAFQSFIVVAVLEFILITVPLLYHFLYGMALIYNSRINVHNYGFTGNWRHVLQRVCGLVVFLFLIYHVYQTGALVWNNLVGYQYLKEMMYAHQTITAMIIYWIALLCAAYYFCNGLWGFLIDWGISAGRLSQRIFLSMLTGLFVVMAVCILSIVVYQLAW